MYQLDFGTGNRSLKIHDVCSTNLLSTVHDESIGSQLDADTTPPAELVDGSGYWEMKEILNSRRKGRWKKFFYTVLWAGMQETEESGKHVLEGAPLLVADFHHKNPMAPKSDGSTPSTSTHAGLAGLMIEVLVRH